MKKTIIYCIVLLMTTSCSRLHTTGGSIIPGTVKVNTPDVQGKVVIDKSKVLTGFSKTITVLVIFKFGDKKFVDADIPGPARTEIKRAALYKALEGTDYDIIVNPKYIIEKENILYLIKIVSCQVSGYGGTIKILD